MTTDRPNPEDFSYALDETDYRVELEVSGTMYFSVKASSVEEAREKAHTEADRLAEDIMGIELDELEDIEVGYVHKPRKMYRVTRDGRKMRVSALAAGDLPREADERGF